MKQKLIHALLLLLIVVPEMGNAATTSLHSSVRYPRESYRNALRRYVTNLNRYHQYLPLSDQQAIDTGKSALQSAVPWRSGISFENLPHWSTGQQSMASFQRIRDTRFMMMDQMLRRISWLYPDDGCFVRAGLVSHMLEEWHLGHTGKVFVFGNLSVKTDNHPSGSVSWWYHVASAFRLNGAPYIIDPSIHPSQPLPLENWLGTMVENRQDLRVAICQAGSYVPSSPCNDNKLDDKQNLLQAQRSYLSREWSRQVQLGRDPEQVLGPRPPWSQN